MKRVFALLLSVSLLISIAACAKEAPQVDTPIITETTTETTAPPTTESLPTESETEPLPTEPNWEPGQIKVNGIGVCFSAFQRGDQVVVLGTWENYYVIEGEIANLLIDSSFIRLEEEDIPEEYDAWAKHNTAVYGSAYCMGEPTATLAMNTQIKVLDGKDNWLFIQWEENTGYVMADQISNQYIYNGGNNSGGGSGGSGSQDGTDVDIGGLSAQGNLGGQIVLLGEYNGPDYEIFDAPVNGTVLSDNTDGYLQILSRDEEVKVTDVREDAYSLLIGGLIGSVPRWAVRMGEEETYEAWTSYANGNTKAYTDIQLRNQLKGFYHNEQVQVVDVIDELGVYIVMIDGVFAYVEMAQLSQTTHPAGNGGGSGGENGSSDNDSGWTPPAM